MDERTSASGGTYLGHGFVLALCVRLLTAAMAILVPLYAVSALGVAAATAGVYILLLWVGNAAGVAIAVVAVRHQSYSSMAGFVLVALSLVGLAGSTGAAAPLLIFAVGVGVGMPQPFLSAFMHSDSVPGRPFSGLGYYSSALGVGLILGPLIAFVVYPVFGFPGVFYGLSFVCVLGVAAAVLGHGKMASRPRPAPPNPGAWMARLRNGPFGRAVMVNFLYSLLLPVFLSYGAVFAQESFGLTSSDSLLTFTAIFSVSVILRFVAVSFEGRLGKLLVVAAAFLAVSTLTLGFAQSWQLFVVGMLLFSLPHAYVFPIANYFALSSSPDDVINASYAFQASSAAAEFVTPALAVVLIPSIGVHGLFLVGGALAFGVLLASIPYSRDGTKR